jgi:phosphoribosylamine-glycine ligase
MKFIVATTDYVGLGFAVRLQREGHQAILAVERPDSLAKDEEAAFAKVGDGLVEKRPLREVFEKRSQYRDWYWIWDFNHTPDLNETLRREGFKVIAGGKFADSMEHDRKACVDFVSKYGLKSPPSFAFDDPAAAIRHCEENPKTAYVYKPDVGDKYETFLPESQDAAAANFELRSHLGSCRRDGTFILQERKEGIETNVEVWFQCGKPVVAFMTLECKRKHVYDLGPLVGCAFDFVFTIPLDCRAVRESVGKLFPAYEEMKYTGFGDANFIAARDGVWFFEKCERFGYSSHPNMFYNLALKDTGTILANFCDGISIKDCFSGGFGAAVTLNTLERHGAGKVVQYPESLEGDIYWWDTYREDGHTSIAGFDHEGDVLIVTAYGYTMPTAWEALMRKANEIRFPYRHYRIDGADVNFPTSPVRRYEALKAMGYI